MACLQIFLIIFFEVVVSIKRKSTSLTGLKIRVSSALALRSVSEGLYLICLEGLNSGYKFLFKKELHFFNIFGPVMFNISRVAFVLFNRIGILMDSRFVLCNRIWIRIPFGRSVSRYVAEKGIRTCNDKCSCNNRIKIEDDLNYFDFSF